MLRGCAVLAILLVAYLLVIFLIPFAHTAVFWVSFVFTLIAFGVVAAACWLAFARKPDTKSRFYGFPIARIGVIYGAAMTFGALDGYKDAGQRSRMVWNEIAVRATINAGSAHTVGLKADGTVVAVGSTEKEQCNVSGWTGIKLPG